MISPLRRSLAVLSCAVIFGTVAACGGENSNTDCSLNACTITFDRGADASASVLGIKAELVAVNGNQVTLKVGGQRLTVPVGDSGQSDGFNVSVQSVTKDNVVIRISQGN
jgi:hypothetical protein